MCASPDCRNQQICFLLDTQNAPQSPVENNYIFPMVPSGVEDNKRSESHLGNKTLKMDIYIYTVYIKLIFLIHFTISVFIAYTLCPVKHTLSVQVYCAFCSSNVPKDHISDLSEWDIR